MALNYKATKEEHGALDESLQSLYIADGEGFKLDVVGTDEAKELKEALRKEREEKAGYKTKLTEKEKAADEAEQARLKEKGEFKALWEAEQAKQTMTSKELADLKDKIANNLRTTSAMSVASALTRDTEKADLLSQQAMKFVTHTAEGVKINGPDGSAWTPEQLGQHLTEKYPFLVDGSQASGGGAGGGAGGGSGEKKLTSTQKIAAGLSAKT